MGYTNPIQFYTCIKCGASDWNRLTVDKVGNMNRICPQCASVTSLGNAFAVMQHDVSTTELHYKVDREILQYKNSKDMRFLKSAIREIQDFINRME